MDRAPRSRRYPDAHPQPYRPLTRPLPGRSFGWPALTPCVRLRPVARLAAGGPFGGLVREVRDERDLVRRCREGSEAAYAELVRSHRPRLYLLAYRLTGDRETAEDVVQETFLAAFRSIEKVDPRPSLSPWLNTIVLRTAGRAASRARSRAGSSLDQAASGELGRVVAGHAIGDTTGRRRSRRRSARRRRSRRAPARPGRRADRPPVQVPRGRRAPPRHGPRLRRGRA